MSSLLKKYSGKIDLIYIDPPFGTGADFTYKTFIGEGNINTTKEQSIYEEKAYRDTWKRDTETYLSMLFERLKLIKSLLKRNGSIYLHCDWHYGHYIKSIMDEVFGKDNFVNEIIWHYKTGGRSRNFYARKHDTLFFYKNGEDYIFNSDEIGIPRGEVTKHHMKKNKDEDGRIYWSIKSAEKIYKYYEDDKLTPEDVWSDISHMQQKDPQRLDFPTQKPKALLERIIKASSNENDLIADFFCGSGTTCEVAERLGRRWIGCDLSRWAIHTTRKRLLEIEDCKPFEILNLGKYERQYWQDYSFGREDNTEEEIKIFQYISFILKLYGAEPISGTKYLHGNKNNALVHIGSVDSPVTISEINYCIEECLALKQKVLHILGWEWEMGLYELIVKEAKSKGIKLTLLNIPREVMEKQAVEKGDVKFFELAYLEVDIEKVDRKKIKVNLKDFAMSNIDIIPKDIREKVTKWSDYIDYWAVDWNFNNDTFVNGWVTYRTKKDRSLNLSSDIHKYEESGKYTIFVKVVDIFGNDTSVPYEIEVE